MRIPRLVAGPAEVTAAMPHANDVDLLIADDSVNDSVALADHLADVTSKQLTPPRQEIGSPYFIRIDPTTRHRALHFYGYRQSNGVFLRQDHAGKCLFSRFYPVLSLDLRIQASGVDAFMTQIVLRDLQAFPVS